MEHPRIYAGVDTHSDTHTLALIDEYGRPLATQTFMTDPTGYERLVAMIGDPDACLGVGVEGTNSYGAALTRRLVEAGYDVHEVLRPKRSVRRRDGKSDPVDALAAARSVLAGDGTSVPVCGRIKLYGVGTCFGRLWRSLWTVTAVGGIDADECAGAVGFLIDSRVPVNHSFGFSGGKE